MLPLDLAIAAQLDANGVLVGDTPCRKCGYNLRGLHHQHRCPECGSPVGLSLGGDLLRYADPKWVRGVARGLTIIFWMSIFAVVCALVGSCFAGMIGGSGGKLIVQALTLGVTAISVYGVWLITEPDPSGIGEDPHLTARKIVRIALLIGVVGQVVQMIIEGGSFPASIRTTLVIIAALIGLVSLVGEFYKYTYFEILSRRIPSEKLERRARNIKWLYVIALGALLVGGVIGAVAFAPMLNSTRGGGMAPPMQAGGAVIFGILMAIGLVAMLILYIATVVLLYGLKRDVSAAATDAELVWMAQTR